MNMKDQLRLQIRGRKNATSKQTDVLKNKNMTDATTAFRPFEEVNFEPKKVEKPVRKSGRIATKKMTQTVLNLKAVDKEETDINSHKRKADSLPKDTKKKHKIIHSAEKEKIKDKEIITEQVERDVETPSQEENVVLDEPIKVNEKEVEVKEREIEIKEIEIEVNEREVEVKEKEMEYTERRVDIKEKEVIVEKTEMTTKEIVVKKRKAIEQEEEEEEEKEETVTKRLNEPADDLFHPTEREEETPNYDTPVDSPSPPSGLTEPYTPPVYAEAPSAPYKTYLTEADKIRIEEEKLTLTKLRKALDIVITDRMARSKPTLYHQIEPVLRNSTRKSVTISHICKVMYIAPNLYSIEAKELRDFGGKVTEAFSIQFDKEWQAPLAGKDFQKRSDILKNGLENYFNTHKEPDATVPEFKLPRLSLVVDKKDWINNAHLPAGIKALLETHKKISEAEEESKKPKPKPVGTVKDRMAALRERLAKKKSS